MESDANSTSFVPAIRKLTFAIWALVTVVSLNLVAAMYRAFVPRVFSLSNTSSVDYGFRDEFANFHDWPIEKQVQSASVIAFATYRKEDGKLKCVITSIPKQKPDADFNFKVGDEYRPESRYPRENTSYGDGEIMFFTGSPAIMRYSASYSGDRVLGLGDIPLQKLSEIIEREK